MLLAIDVGNSNTVLGLYDGDKLIYDWRIRTVSNHTVDEYGMLIVNLYKTVKSKSSRSPSRASSSPASSRPCSISWSRSA